MKKIFIIILFIAQHYKSDAQITMPDYQAMQYVSSNFGNALNFDGTSTYGLGKVYVNDSLLDFTLEFWIKNTEPTTLMTEFMVPTQMTLYKLGKVIPI